MGKAQLLDGGTVRLGGVGTPYYYTGVSLFYAESTAGGCVPPGVAHPRWRQTQVQASPNVFHDSGHRRPVSYAFHISIPGFGHRGPLSVCTCGIRALGFGQMLMVLSRVTQPTTPPSLRANCLKPNILGLSWSLACCSIQAWLFKQHF